MNDVKVSKDYNKIFKYSATTDLNCKSNNCFSWQDSLLLIPFDSSFVLSFKTNYLERCLSATNISNFVLR